MTIFDVNKVSLQIAEKLREAATRQGVIPFKTGDLRKSIYVERLGRGITAVGSNLAYARAVHDGRKAITIRPNLAKNPPRGYREHTDPKRARLKFVVGGRLVFAKEVRQPARKGNPFFRKAVRIMNREGFDFVMPKLVDAAEKHLDGTFGKAFRFEMKL